MPPADLEAEVETLAARMTTVPINPLAMQKMVINQAIEATGLVNTQTLAAIFDGITRHSPEALNFKARSELMGWKQAVSESDGGSFDGTLNPPVNGPE